MSFLKNAGNLRLERNYSINRMAFEYDFTKMLEDELGEDFNLTDL